MTLGELAHNYFGWMPPCCWECGKEMTVTRINQLENTLCPTDGLVEYRCVNFKDHHAFLLWPFIVFERTAGIDKIKEYGWND